MSYMKRLYEEVLEQIDWSLSNEEIEDLSGISEEQIETAREVYED